MSVPPNSGAPVVGQYVATFLKPEMWHIYRQIRTLAAFRPVVFCQKRENADRFPFEAVVTLRKPRTHQLRRLWQKSILGRPITIYQSEARRLEAQLDHAGAKLLHIYFGHIGVHLLPFIRMTKRPVVVSFHGADAQVEHEKPAFARMSREMLERVQLVLVRSASIAERLVAHGCAPEKIRLHRTGVPLGEMEFQQRTPPADGVWRWVQACRLIPKKGLRTTLAAFQKFVGEYPQAELVIAGEGPMRAELEAEVSARGLAARVKFPGFLSQADLRALYYRSHLFVHPSEVGPDGDQEGVPNSMLEAMATGLPVVATRHGGIPEAVEEEISGCLVPERDAELLTAAALKLTREANWYEAVSAAASVRVRKEFDLDRQTSVLEGHYRTVLSAVADE